MKTIQGNNRIHKNLTSCNVGHCAVMSFIESSINWVACEKTCSMHAWTSKLTYQSVIYVVGGLGIFSPLSRLGCIFSGFDDNEIVKQILNNINGTLWTLSLFESLNFLFWMIFSWKFLTLWDIFVHGSAIMEKWVYKGLHHGRWLFERQL